LRRRGWQLPRRPTEFTGMSTAGQQPVGPHVVRPSHRGEPRFLPDGPDDLRQYRGLLRMADDATVVGHPRLPARSVADLPAGLGLGARLLLAATPTRSGERDTYLWNRDHRAADPDCPQCT